MAVHTSASGSGAVGVIDGTAAGSGCSSVVTIGADRAVAVLDPRAGFACSHKFTEHRCVRVCDCVWLFAAVCG